MFFCKKWFSNDAPSWRHFACSLKKEDVGYCRKLSGRRESELLAISARGKRQCLPLFSSNDPPFFPLPVSSQQPSHLSPKKPTTVTHILLFQTACEITSRQSIIAGPVSPKNHMYTTQALKRVCGLSQKKQSCSFVWPKALKSLFQIISVLWRKKLKQMSNKPKPSHYRRLKS